MPTRKGKSGQSLTSEKDYKRKHKIKIYTFSLIALLKRINVYSRIKT